jgi:SAM-dependent methyltransferase
MRNPERIAFEKHFRRGHKSYDTQVGDWWDWRATDGPHRAAYKHVIDCMRRYFRAKGKQPQLLLDYACGGATFLTMLAQAFPETCIVGLDGSRRMLERAAQRLEGLGIEADVIDSKKAFGKTGPRIRLAQTRLPNFSLPQGACDGVAFVFPNITAVASDQPYYDKHGYKNPRDTQVGRMLARFREMDPEDEVGHVDPDERFDGLMTERVVARNIRGLLRKGMPWFKVDYANAHRKELSELTNWRSFFSECALETPIKEKNSDVLFHYVKDEFKRSRVILDVYHQTRDASDKTGGYFVTWFDAV